MVKLKTTQEIETLARGGALLATLLDELSNKIAVGVTGMDLDNYAREFCKEHDVIPSFLGYAARGHDPYPAAVCVSVNSVVVHGIPNTVPFKEGDLVSIDMGIIYEGLFLDSARTVAVGAVLPEVKTLMEVTKTALQRAIEAATVGNTTGDIGHAVEQYVLEQAKNHGISFGIVTQLVGHGVGYGVHEEPSVPNVGPAGRGEVLKEGLVIAIEPMITIGNPFVETADDGWSIVTEDNGLAAHEEHTVAITENGSRILTKT